MNKEDILIKCLQNKVNSDLELNELNKYSVKELTPEDLYLIFEYTNVNEHKNEAIIFFKTTLIGTTNKIKYCFGIVSFLKEQYVAKLGDLVSLLTVSIIDTSDDYATILDTFIKHYNYRLNTHELLIHKDTINFYTIYNNDSKL
jgi:hypothetical protein